MTCLQLADTANSFVEALSEFPFGQCPPKDLLERLLSSFFFIFLLGTRSSSGLNPSSFTATELTRLLSTLRKATEKAKRRRHPHIQVPSAAAMKANECWIAWREPWCMLPKRDSSLLNCALLRELLRWRRHAAFFAGRWGNRTGR